MLYELWWREIQLKWIWSRVRINDAGTIQPAQKLIWKIARESRAVQDARFWENCLRLHASICYQASPRAGYRIMCSAKPLWPPWRSQGQTGNTTVLAFSVPQRLDENCPHRSTELTSNSSMVVDHTTLPYSTSTRQNRWRFPHTKRLKPCVLSEHNKWVGGGPGLS